MVGTDAGTSVSPLDNAGLSKLERSNVDATDFLVILSGRTMKEIKSSACRHKLRRL
jgi:hypothetical protein